MSFYWCFALLNLSLLVPSLQQQLQALLETLSATEPHYIRCVKPNNLLKPAIFESSNVLQQLRCGVSVTLCLSDSLTQADTTMNGFRFICTLFRELWKQLGSAVRDSLLGRISKSSFVGFASWHLMF